VSSQDLKFIVVGLGSMGKRRVRCLQALGYRGVSGFDLRADRRKEAADRYGIRTFEDIEAAVAEVKPHALIISVPPDVHHIYMKVAVRHRIHFFVEASVVDTDMDAIRRDAEAAGIVAAPSATLRFHPGIRKITELVKTGALGKVSNLIYHCGQYLPDWHTYEKVSEYYVSNPATGGAREIVPFELTWVTDILGLPRKVFGNVRRTIRIEGAERIDDTYNCLLDYGDHLATITIDVVSRSATRRLTINGVAKQLRWDWSRNCVDLFDPAKGEWESLGYEVQKAAAGYNPNIGEQMYIDELCSFIDATLGKGRFINTLADDHAVLKLLYAIEAADRAGSAQPVLA
jgi:predicted dehydrogenase